MKAIKKMSKKSWIITGIIGVVVILVIVFVGVVASRRVAANSTYQTEVLAKGDLTAIVGATGTVNSDHSAILNWQTSGQVENVNVQIGDTVTSDQVLANLLLSSLPQSVIGATSDLVTAQRNLTNLQLSNVATAKAWQALANAQKAYDDAKNRVLDPASNSVQEVDQSNANFAVAKAQLEDAQREYDRLKNGPDPSDISAAQARVDAIQATVDAAKQMAPFAGTVTEALPNVGDLVTPGTEAFRIDDLQHLSVDIQITEIDITKVAIGQDATLVFDAIPDKTYQGKVTRVAKAGDVVQGVANFMVTVVLTDADSSILPGMTAAVNITVSNITNVLIVPNRAIRVINGVATVYVLQNSVATPVTITLGASSDTNSEVTAGNLQPGDLIILNPPTSIIPAGAGRNPFGG
jgi:HlyD family secretion protein